MDNKLKTVDAETLLSTPMSKTMFIVDGLISQGVNVISGASKIGKSWLMLWLGLQVAQGNSIWGLPTLQCDVLYLSLEDTQRRIKDRLYNLTDSAPDNLYFAVTSGLIGGGLEEQITDFLTEHPATKLVIIDTLQKVRDSKGSAGKAGMYGNDYDDISSIKRIADGFNIAILLVHHLRKLQDSDDPFNDVSGSTGIIGAADTNFILRRKRSGNAATLLVSGRDVEYQELTLQFNDLVWELVERRNSEDMFYSEMLRKVKPNTVIHYHAIIHSALKYAVKTDMLVQNVADKVDRPKKNSFQPVFLSAEEMQKMFEALRGTKLELPVLVAAFYGFRRGEVLGLKWDAIDFERKTISVIRTVTTITLDGKQTEIEQQSAKTKSSLRTLPLIGSFREYFLQVKETQELNKQVCGNCYNHEYDGFVFVDELGERMRANYLTSAFPKFLEDHGLRRMRFHDLRHSCASLLLANGVPLKHIQEWLGHSDFTTTANIYAHLDYKSKITSAQAMETGLALPEGGDFGSRWGSIDVGENG